MPPQTPLSYLSDFHTYWSNAIREHSVGRASGGLITAIRKIHNAEVLESTPWWIFNKVQMSNTTIIIGSVYFLKSIEIQQLLELLQDSIDYLRESQQFDILLIGGDMNFKVGLAEMWPEIFTGATLNDSMTTTDHTVRERGHKLLGFMTENNFILINGRSASDFSAQPTFDERGTSIIDLI